MNAFLDIADRVRNAISSKSGLTVRHVVPVSQIPRTTSGKLQRYQLREAFEKGAFDSLLEQLNPLKQRRASRVEAPESDTEKQIAAIWQQLLEIDSIGRQDNFFDIGGDSLKAVDLHVELQNVFRVEFPLALLYEHMTIADMAAYLSTTAQAPPDFTEALVENVTARRKEDQNRRAKRRALQRRHLHG